MMNTIEYKNAKIFYTSKGKGPTVVFLHGFLENSTMWNDIGAELSKSYRIISVDLLGHGHSECLGYMHSMEDMAAVVSALIRKLRIRKYRIVGHSMGGYVALNLAQSETEKIKGLCLMNSTSKADSSERKKLRVRAIKMAQENYKTLVQLSFTNLFSEASRVLFEKELKAALKEALKTPVQGYIAAQEGMKQRLDTQAFLTTAPFQKLFIIGKKDTVLEYQDLQNEAQQTQSDLAVLDQGHMSHIENKTEVIAVLMRFLKKC